MERIQLLLEQSAQTKDKFVGYSETLDVNVKDMADIGVDLFGLEDGHLKIKEIMNFEKISGYIKYLIEFHYRIAVSKPDDMDQDVYNDFVKRCINVEAPVYVYEEDIEE